MIHSLLHPLRLIVSVKVNPTEQDRLVKLHTDVVPEWTKRVPVLKMDQNQPLVKD